MTELLICVMIAVLGGWVAEQWMTPTPISVFRRPWRANLIHASVLIAVFGLYLIVLRRPWLTAALTLGLPILLIIVNNTKHAHLREPFLASDWIYFVEALRYPRLYFPFFGALKATLMLGAFVSVLILWLWLEPVWSGNINTLVMVGLGCAVGGAIFLRWACLSWPAERRSYDYDAESDVTQWGLFATLALYGHDLKRSPIAAPSPFLSLDTPESKRLPHFIAIQAESFFDLKRHFAGHMTENWLIHWEALNHASQAHGPLIVPAWGANTVRTEFAFLTGLCESQLGIHRFQPYASALKHPPLSLARCLKGFGYETVFVHPYLKNFYNRHRVIPELGFDSFVDLTAFDTPVSPENYVSDLAVGEALVSLLKHAQGPTFLHAVTMAGHGPYTRKGAEPAEVLDKYAARMTGTDAMIGYLHEALPKLDRPVVLCVYGDHPPILPEVYAWLGMPDGTTDYAVWCSQPNEHSSCTPKAKTISAHDLALTMLRTGGFVEKPVP
jgi:hypothetical protein